MDIVIRALPFLCLCVAALAAFPASAAPGPLAAAVQPFVDSHSVAGAVLLAANRDGTLDVETVGFMDIAAKRPMRPDALFWIASQSKAMTAAAVMMLVDEGKIGLDDPVAKYLPEFGDTWLAVEQDKEHILLRRPNHAITVRQILSHTSGLPFSSAIEQPTLDAHPLREAVVSYALTPLQTQPGTHYAYSNAGINTAARILEVVSGMPYEVFMQKRLFDPLGMKDTTFWPTKAQQKRLATSYKPTADKHDLEPTTVTQLQYPLDDRTKRFPMPAGGLFSTAEDVARFCRMLLNAGSFDGRRILSEEAVRTMTTKQTPAGVDEGYGFGLTTDGVTYGHSGAYSTNMAVDTRRNLVTVYLVQHAGFANNGDQTLGAFQRAAQERWGR